MTCVSCNGWDWRSPDMLWLEDTAVIAGGEGLRKVVTRCRWGTKTSGDTGGTPCWNRRRWIVGVLSRIYRVHCNARACLLLPPFLNTCLSRHFNKWLHTKQNEWIYTLKYVYIHPYVVVIWNVYKDKYLGTEGVECNSRFPWYLHILRDGASRWHTTILQ